MAGSNRSIVIIWLIAAIFGGIDVYLWIIPTPISFERRQFMPGCLTASGYSDEAQRRCYQHFLQYEAVKARDWKPAGDPA